MVRVLRASMTGAAVDLWSLHDPAEVLVSGKSQSEGWLLVDAAVLRERIAELRSWLSHHPRVHPMLLCDEDLPCPDQLAEQAGFADWHCKSHLHALGTRLASLAAT